MSMCSVIQKRYKYDICLLFFKVEVEAMINTLVHQMFSAKAKQLKTVNNYRRSN